MKKGCVIGFVLCSGLLLTGCSSFSPAVSGISIDKKGAVTEFVREEFDQSYYDKGELEEGLDAQMKSYNDSAGTKAVRKQSLSVKDGIAQLRMKYASTEDYAEFNHLDFYAGDIQGAVQAGYAFEGKFAEVTDGKVSQETLVWGSAIMTGKNYQTVALRQAMLVEVPGTIKYVSENVKVTDASTAVIEENETAYILYE
ncbi:hypothetical protein BRYFOR_07864 [Marvinbryantia formatexigens DSM 14469]|uniref:Lipoprotein n=1 Tax=Marvinbryantia formatexigens DSM 14469 TaxID=478749 RepID=C6LGV4_9FIRM|nr:hypothetical protein [Marvinbryantia formatexigens]EET60013.1 hypothetical protein BRYFOR_07864 [Marvinbryantia formatexigens DSM 14469]UWO23819.1 hypothetical protein NQ534_15415 [Marvinbryantia formatexigens DSM 14469]SDF72224.1 hypothetical protein SAMN05660368_01221 [Marvinbryantia formatexigens]